MNDHLDRASDHNVALIRRYYAAFNAGDWNGMLACLGDDVVHDINQGQRETGKPAFRAFLAHMERCYKEQLRDIVVMASDDGKHGSAEFVVHGEYLATDAGLPPANGQVYILPAGAFFDLRGDKITRVTNYYNLPDWTAQVVGKG
jgi:steroid delta-isomerase-like uncharacterized protein